ncbi:DUF5996 family protein [Hyphobacterium sp.]|uniref:DUF5996 family protein n=1 Tax=Hyphobacterium sp. TaxID=2004662 RepID=UPI003BABFAEC
MTLWPDIPYARFAPTGATLHMWFQIVGKFRLAQTPWQNHSWQATYYVNARGLTTSIVHAPEGSFEVVFDFVDHQLIVQSADGRSASMKLEAMPVADFHARFIGLLEALDAPTDFHGAPNEVPDPVPFDQQKEISPYNAEAAADFWRAMVSIDAVFKHFRTGFLGKASPVHFFWGASDLAVTRFSGRDAPLHPGGFPALPDAVTREAYSHEVSSAGFWPGGNGIEEAAFYSYAYPSPDGFSDTPMSVDGAYFHEALGEFILPYEAVRTTDDPEGTLLTFLHETYEGAANLGNWDRKNLECELGLPRIPRALG